MLLQTICWMWNILKNSYFIDWASLTQMIKNLLAMWETWVQSLNWEHPLKKGMATQSSVLAWRIPRREKPGRLQSVGLQSCTWLKQLGTHTFNTKEQNYKLALVYLIYFGIFSFVCTVVIMVLAFLNIFIIF